MHSRALNNESFHYNTIYGKEKKKTFYQAQQQST